MKRAIFFDRDGVINSVLIKEGKPFSPRKYKEFKLLSGVRDVLFKLKEGGFLCIIVTNQPDVARGFMKLEELEKMHKLIKKNLPIDDIMTCIHDDQDNCGCRKPKPGMLIEAARKWNIDLKNSVIVGDTWKDIEAGRSVECKTILLDAPYNQKVSCDYRVKNLNEIVDILLEEQNMSYLQKYLEEVKEILNLIDISSVDKMIRLIATIKKDGGRLFFIGVGGGAANASHAVNDFRKIAGIEAYAPTDNASELTARVNDDGWDTVFVHWLKGSKISGKDGLFVFSVGGGNEEKKISMNIIKALDFAKSAGAKVMGVVGRDGGYTAKVADACVIIPTVNHETITPHTESFQAIIWHLIVSHPAIKSFEMKWESVK